MTQILEKENLKELILNKTKEELKLFNFELLINWEENKSLK